MVKSLISFHVANLSSTIIYFGTTLIYSGNLTLENVGTAVNYRGIFIILAQGYHGSVS
jgi:hypothetical protein